MLDALGDEEYKEQVPKWTYDIHMDPTMAELHHWNHQCLKMSKWMSLMMLHFKRTLKMMPVMMRMHLESARMVLMFVVEDVGNSDDSEPFDD